MSDPQHKRDIRSLLTQLSVNLQNKNHLRLNISNFELVTFLDLPRVKMNLKQEQEINVEDFEDVFWYDIDFQGFLDVDKSFQIGFGFCNPGIMDWFFFIGGSRKYDCSVERILFSEAAFGHKYVQAMHDCCRLQGLIWRDYKGAMRLMMDHLQLLQAPQEGQKEVSDLGQTIARLSSAAHHRLTSPEVPSQSFRILACNVGEERSHGCNLASHVPSNRGLAIGFNLPEPQYILSETIESAEFAQAVSGGGVRSGKIPVAGPLTFQFIVQRSEVNKRMEQLERGEMNVEKDNEGTFLLNLHDVDHFPDLRQRFITLEQNTIHKIKV